MSMQMFQSLVLTAFLQTAALVTVLAVINPHTHAPSSGSPQPLASPNKVLVILLDGFRWDTVPRDSRGFRRLYEHGSHAKSMQPCFPSVSMTNYYSIMTGLYPESHGIINNRMYDAEHNMTFNLDLNHTENHEPFWWDGGEPIWITATKHNKKVWMYRWPGCEVTIRQFKLPPGHCLPLVTWNMTIQDLEGNVMKALTKLADDEADFVGIYYVDPDEVQHHNGPNSMEARKLISEIDDVIFKMQEEIESQTSLMQRLNVIIVSDHGMTSISPDRIVDLRKMNMSDIDRTLRNTPLSIWPKKGREDAVYNRLQKTSNATVYKKEDIPERWNYKNNARVSPISVVPDLGYTILTPGKPEFPTFAGNMLKGTHGYDNQFPDMQAIFAARGPNFKKNFTIDTFRNVELYQMMCYILGIKASVNNGTWALKDILEEEPVSYKSLVMTVVGALVIVLLLSVIVCGGYYFKQKTRTKQYRTLPTNIDNELENDDLEL